MRAVRIYFFISLLTGISMLARAQALDFKDHFIKLEKNLEEPVFSLPFKQIIVKDYRFDTTNLGIVMDVKHKWIKLEDGVHTALQNYIQQKTISTSNEKNLVVVLKTLRMQEIWAGEINAETKSETAKISQCRIVADLFSTEADKYKALIRIDTVFNKLTPLRAISENFIREAIDHLLQKVYSMDVETILSNKNSIREEDIWSHYNAPFSKNRFTINTKQRGIYKSFSDFLNSRPDTISFSLDKDDESDYLYINENGEEKLYTDFWGFSDGENLYVRIGYNFFRLYKTGNSFGFWGCLQAIHHTKSRNKNRVGSYAMLGVMSELRSARLKNILRPMQLDMETGLPY